MKDDTRFNSGRFGEGRFSGKKPKDQGANFSVSVLGLTANPDFGLTAQIGAPLTATATNWSGEVPGSVAWQWLDSSGPIGTGATYTPQASDDLESIYAVAMPSEIYSPQNSTSYTVRHAPPVLGSGISSKNLTHLGDEKTIISNVRNHFTGNGLTFGVFGYAGARLDGNALIIDPMDLTAGATIRLTATNSGGSVSHTFNLVVEALQFVSVTLTGSGKIGSPHAAAASVNRANAVLSYEFRRNSVPIAGANQASYTPVGSDDLTNLTVAVTALLDGARVVAESAALAVTHVAPSASGNLENVTFPSGSGDKSIDASSDFTGAGISYSVSAPGIPGVSIDTATGVVAIPTGSSASGTITVTGTNSGGSASTNFNAKVELAGTPATIPTVLTNVLDFGDGDTISLSEAREVFQYADGSFGVISVGGDVVITADSPASVAQPDDGYVAHGMMHTDDIRIIEDTSTIDQGWDEMMGDQPKLTNRTYSTGYSSALNKAPSNTGANLGMAASGGIGGVVKVKRRTTLSTSNGKYQNAAVLEKIMIVHAVPAAPPIGSVRPPIMGVDLGLSAEDADLSGVRDFVLPSGLPDISICKSYLASDQLFNIYEGERRRGLCVGPLDYARDILSTYMAPAALYLYHPSTSEADRKALIAGFLRKATDAYGTQSAGAAPGGGAGQRGVDQFAMAVVSTIFPSNVALRTASHQRLSNLNDLALWPNAADIGHDSDFLNLATSVGPGKHNHQPLLPEMVGYPHWVVESNAAKNGRLSPINNSDMLARYRSTIYQMALIGAAVTGLAEGGWEALWGPQSTWDQTNDKFATLGVIEQGYTINGSKIRPVDDAPNWARQLWDAHRPTMPEGGTPVPVAPQPPMQFAGEFSSRVAAYQEDFGLAGVSAIANSTTGVDFDFTKIMNDGSPFTGSVLPLTGRQICLSHDGVQWAAPVDVGVTGSLTFSGKRWLRERRRNSEGWSPWSGNWPQLNGRDLVPAQLRNIFSGGAIPAGTPVNAEAPKIYKYRYGEGRDNVTPGFWLFDEQPSAMGPEQTKLIAGSGLWADGIAGISYQWQIRTNADAPTDIPGATKQEYIRTHDVLSSITATREICCVVTADDGNGNATSIATNWITMPIPTAVINDYSKDPSPIVGLRGGTAEWRQAEGVLRIYPNQVDTFAGVLNRIDGLIVGQEYTFQAVISARDVGVGAIDGQLGDTTTLTGANPTTENELGGQLAGTLKITRAATAPTMYLSVRFRGMPPVGSWIDVTEVRAIPQFADAQSVPSAMSAPIVTTSGESSISIDRAAAPDDGGSAITSYDLRWQPDGGAWTTVSGIGDPQSIGGLVPSTLHHVQTRAVNAVGQGAWSASGSAFTADIALPTGGWSDDFATDSTADYTQLDATKGYDEGSQTMTVTPTAAWGGVATPAIALETGHSYQINVYIENTMTSGVADFSMGSMLAGNADDKGSSDTIVGPGTSGIATGSMTAVNFTTLYLKPRVRGTGVGSFKVHYFEIFDVT